jgi:hypothetical protein
VPEAIRQGKLQNSVYIVRHSVWRLQGKRYGSSFSKYKAAYRVEQTSKSQEGESDGCTNTSAHGISIYEDMKAINQ